MLSFSDFPEKCLLTLVNLIGKNKVGGVRLRALLVVEGVWKRFGDRDVVRDVSLLVNEGEIVSLLGPNGAGKTTLLKIITGVLRPDSGRVLIKGLSPEDLKARALVGFCPQEPGLIDDLTGLENMMFYARLQGLDGKNVVKRVEGLLKIMGLSGDMGKLVRKYSGGMKKKLGLAATLIHDPEILILDEPTTGMDPGVRREVWRIIQQEKRSGKAILIATHYMEEAEALSDRVYIIDQGRIVASGTPSELKSKYAPPSVIEVELYRLPENADATLKDLGLRYTVHEDKLRVHSSDVDRDVPRLVALIHENGGAVKILRVTEPTLEDVFLKLTGRGLES
ncbi:MAG: ABC transporter ATP-binding protein [Thermoprotei archaeon]|nr:MAG: ABC transporter ATP-binding protein [Thermoprotei archaeon]